MKYTVVNEEVLYAGQPLSLVSTADIALLKDMAARTKRRRIRLCTHPDPDDRLHEMLIVHAAGAYVRPHKHPGKSESFHVIEGRLAVIIYEDDGAVRERLTLGPFGQAGPFYYRLSESLFHTVVPLTDWVVFHETTNGPFRREETDFAEWAPAEEDEAAGRDFVRAGLGVGTDG